MNKEEKKKKKKRSKQICKFFKAGKCIKGSKCRFSHALDPKNKKTNTSKLVAQNVCDFSANQRVICWDVHLIRTYKITFV
jgi:hypothetical protein